MIVQTGLGVQGELGGTAVSECQLATIATFCGASLDACFGR